MKIANRVWCGFILLIILFTVLGYNLVDSDTQLKDTHTVKDYTATTIQVPNRAHRIIPVGVSTEDMVIALAGTDRIVALGNLPNNFPEESQKVQAKVKMNTEAILALQPDLLIVPDWVDPEMVTTLRALNVPVYVYTSPKNVEESEDLILKLSALLDEETTGKELVDSMQGRLANITAYTASIKERKVVALYGVLGITGGLDSTFNNMTDIINAANAAAMLGLDVSERGGREDLLRINPDVIIVPSNVYSFDQYKEIEVESLYNDPAFQNIKAVKNHQVYVIDARWLMSYSQFMVNGIEELAKDVYGYKAE